MEVSPLKPRVCGSISESGTQKKNVVPKTYQENFANKKIEKMFLHIFLDKKKRFTTSGEGRSACRSLGQCHSLIFHMNTQDDFCLIMLLAYLFRYFIYPSPEKINIIQMYTKFLQGMWLCNICHKSFNIYG